MADSEWKYNLADVFNAFAKKATVDFPALNGELAIYNGLTDTLHGVFDDAQKKRLHKIAKKYLQLVEKYSKEQGLDTANFGAYALHPADNGEGHSIIDWLTDTANHTLSSVQQLLKHELGHLVAPGADEGDESLHAANARESISDIFSMLYQQPENKALLENAMYNKKTTTAAALILQDDVMHFSFPAIQALEGLSARHDLSALTPLQAANLAYRLLLLNTPTEQQLRKLVEIFVPARKALAQQGLFAAIKEVEKIMFAGHGENTPIVFAAAKSVAEWFTYDMSMPEGYRDALMQRIKTYEDSLPASAPHLTQRLADETKDMMILGRFDKEPDSKIDPAQYKSKENMLYINRTMDAYNMIRYAQESGEPLNEITPNGPEALEVAGLTREQVIARARDIAEKATPTTPVIYPYVKTLPKPKAAA